MPLREDPTYHVGGLTKKTTFLSLAPPPTLPILNFIFNASFYLPFLRFFLLICRCLKHLQSSTLFVVPWATTCGYDQTATACGYTQRLLWLTTGGGVCSSRLVATQARAGGACVRWRAVQYIPFL